MKFVSHGSVVIRQIKKSGWFRGMAATSLMLLASGCSLAGPLNATAPRGAYDLVANQPYGPGSRQKLDIYRPRNVTSAPILVFFYGGSWQGGSKADYRFLGSAVARRGFVTVIPDYRVFPAVRFPGFLEDAAAAVGWARAHAADFGGDPANIFVVGHSAGAHIAAMLSYDDRWLGSVGLDPRRDLRGFVGLAGPYDFLPLRSEKLKAIFGGDRNVRTQPITFVRGGEPPSFLATGTRDRTVDPGNTRRLAARLAAVGSPVEVREYRGIGHLGIVGSVAWQLRFLTPVLDDVEAFLRRSAKSEEAL